MSTYINIPAASSGGGGSFGSDTLVPLPNSSSANVTAAELITTLPVTTAGAEYSDFAIKLLQNGAQVTGVDLKAANFQGRQTATTATGTPTVALNPRNDLLVITVGADATSLTITGTDLDTDYEYEIVGCPVTATGTTNLRLNGDVAGWTGSFIYSLNGGATATVTMPSLTVVDSADAASAASFKATVWGAPGGLKAGEVVSSSLQGGNRYGERLFGYSGGTANVTSLVFTGGTLKAGSIISLRRTRPTGS